MAELTEIPLELQLKEANRQIKNASQQRAQVPTLLVADVPAAFSRNHGEPNIC